MLPWNFKMFQKINVDTLDRKICGKLFHIPGSNIARNSLISSSLTVANFRLFKFGYLSDVSLTWLERAAAEENVLLWRYSLTKTLPLFTAIIDLVFNSKAVIYKMENFVVPEDDIFVSVCTEWSTTSWSGLAYSSTVRVVCCQPWPIGGQSGGHAKTGGANESSVMCLD